MTGPADLDGAVFTLKCHPDDPSRAFFGLYRLDHGADGKEKRVDLVMDIEDPYHGDYIALLRLLREQGRFVSKKVGIIGTGQGRDILEIADGGALEIMANDLSPHAVLVAGWNMRLHARKNVSVRHGAGLDGMQTADVLVWNVPGIYRESTAHSMIYAIQEKEFRDFLAALASHFRLDPHKRALLRVSVCSRTVQTRADMEKEIKDLLASVELTGEQISSEYPDWRWVRA